MDGIVLKATPYEEDGKILKVFTQELGLISVIVKKLGRKGSYWQTITSPLARSELHLTRRQSNLYTLQEATLINAHLEIRSNLEALEAAFSLLRTLLFSQCAERPSFELYQLTLAYLRRLQTFPRPYILALSFQMKLLNHEGLFSETKEPNLSEDEWLLLECLCHAKRFELLEALTVTPEFQKSVEELFLIRIAKGGT